MGNFFTGSSSKEVHAKEIYNLIRKNGAATKSEILNKTGIPNTTLNRTMDELLAFGLIEEAGIDKSSGGRKPILYRIKSDAYFLIGIDISRSSIRIVLTDLNLVCITKNYYEINSESDPETLLNEIVVFIKDMVKKLRINWKRILGIGIGTVGPMDKESGVILDPEGFLSKRWRNIPIKQIFEAALGVFTIIDNGVNAAVMAEYWSNSRKELKNLVYAMIGIGLRCGIVSKGELVSGQNSQEDIYGHIIVELDGRECYCGNRGCVERYASIPAILHTYNEEVRKERGIDSVEITWSQFIEAVRSEELLAKKVVLEAALYLSTGLVNIINILNPQVLILGGPAINTCRFLYEETVSLTREKVSRFHKDILITTGSLQEDTVAVGSATLVLDYFLGRDMVEPSI